MNLIVIIRFMRSSSVAATKLPSGWWPNPPLEPLVHVIQVVASGSIRLKKF